MTNAHISTTTPERYFHRRESMMCFAGKRARGIQAITAFCRKDKDGKWYVSYAQCDHRDQFCRKTGRAVARRKWFAGKKAEIADATFVEVFPDTKPRTPIVDASSMAH